MPASTFVDLLASRADSDLGYTFVSPDGVDDQLSFRELHRRACAIGAMLAARGLAGERLLLVYPPGLDYVTAFFGCLYAGAVAVPVFPPNPARLDRTLPRLTAVASDAQPAAVLTTSATLPLAAAMGEQAVPVPAADWVATDCVPAELAEEWCRPDIAPETVAFIQYTSGSTAAAKGVLLDHQNLMHNSSLIREAFGTDQDTRALSWLPLYHDMGLIGGVLQPLYVGFPIVLMSPLSFLARPMSWLEAISQRGITVSGGPNFAYDLCVRKLDPHACVQLELSGWRVAFNGAEPVRTATLDRFAATFARYGFDRSAFLPCFGLAEATLIVTGKRWHAPVRVAEFDAGQLAVGRATPAHGSEGATPLVGSGRVLGDQDLAVVDPDTGTACDDGTVGEIRVRGPSIGRGYWRQPAQTAENFINQPDGIWLRTGDLGFLSDGELFVTGRRKDLIIVRGRNIYPQDLEQAAIEADAGVRPGCVAAFGIQDGGDELVVLVGELAAAHQDDAGAAADLVRRAVIEACEIPVREVLLVKAGTIPKTSSGKLRRGACRQRYLEGALHALGASSSSTTTEPHQASIDPATLRGSPAPERIRMITRYLQECLATASGLDPVHLPADRRLDSIGLDSLASVEMLHRIETELSVRLPLDNLLVPQPVAALAELVDGRLDATPITGDDLDGLEHGDHTAASDGERALWFLAQLAPESTAYHLARAFTIDPGPDGRGLDVAALDRALCLLLTRHEALRTVVSSRDGEPVATVQPPPMSLVRTVHVADGAVDDELAREVARPFQLDTGPLVRVALVVPNSDRPVLLIVAHHLVLDLWSASILVHELQVAYQALATGAPVRLPPPVRRVAWVRRLAAASDAHIGELRAYWHRRLAGDLPVLDLSGSHPRPAAQTFRGGVVHDELSLALCRRISRLAAASNTTTFVVLLTALQVLLHRHTDQDDILVGTPTATRRDPELGAAVGYLLNTLVLRTDLGRDPAFATLLARNRRTVEEAIAHQDYPFARLVEELAVGRDSTRSPLFQVMLVFDKVPGGDAISAMTTADGGGRLDLGDAVLVGRRLPHEAATFDLTLRVTEVTGRLITCWEYAADVLDASRVEQLAEQFAGLLAQVVDAPELSVGALSLLTPAQQAALTRWNATRAAAPADRCMHELILERAAADPAAVAVRAADTELTYGALVNRANRLATRLRSLGVGPEVPVGVYLRRSPDAVVSILAVLLAGGAYVPLDPETPAARVAHILADARTRVLVTDTTMRDRLPNHTGRVLCLDEPDTTDASACGPPPHTARPENLAYVMYTSGSTGHPKGILVSHANLVHSTHARLGYFPDRVASFLLISSLGFDSSVAGLFWTLYEGGALVLPDLGREQDPAHHRELLARHSVSHFESVPSLYLLLLRQLRPGDLPALRSVVVAGEACPREVYLQHRLVLPQAKLVNEYGPTEGTVWCSAYRAEPALDRAHLPIGRPIANASLHLLDRYGQRTPPGAVGEVYIGGPGIARGYHGRPDLTAERFVPDPFGHRAGGRMYRTGDLARLLPDGNLEFAGRADRQVKVHGVRVEVAEIEVALRGSPGVREALVRPVAGPQGTPVLVAYLVPAEPERLPDHRQMRSHLMERLLTAMIPAAFVWLPVLPLTPHGKVDELALPDVDLSTDSDSAYPVEPVAQVLCEMWADLLGRPIGIDDDFFTVGGHSLLVTQLVARIRATFGVEVTPRAVFASPTVSRLSTVVRQELAGPDARPIPGPRPAVHPGPGPLSYTQERLWFIDRLVPGNVAYNIPVAVRLRGGLDLGALTASLDAVVRRHESLRTTFEMTDSGPVQRIHPPVPLALGHTDLVDRPGDTEKHLAATLSLEARRPFDLSDGPLLRASLYQVAKDEHVLLLVLHHIIADGWSLAVLTDEIAAGYAAAVAGRPDPVPAPQIQYADYAVWQREQFNRVALGEHLAHLSRQLAQAPALRLPTDRPRPPVQSFVGATHHWWLDDATTDDLRAVCRATDSTMFMVLLSTFGLLLAQHSHATDLVVGTPISGRTHIQTEDLIGFFANTLALRLDLSGDPAFTDLVDRVRGVCIDAYVHQEVPFELLIEALQPNRDLSRNPLFQVVFALQNAPRPAPRLSGLELELIEVGTDTAKFDLYLSLWETDRGLRGTFEYNTDLFDPATIARIGAEFGRLLRAVGEDPRRPMSRLTAAGAPHPTPIGAGPVARTTVRARESRLDRLVEEQAALRPTATAVTAHGVRLAYRDLAARAGELAGELRRRGAGAGTRLGLCRPRGPEWTVGLLAILNTGATCVPMDPTRPAEWRERVIGDAQPALVLGTTGNHDRATEQPATAWATTTEAACVCYSADAAAGVVIDHSTLAARVRALRNELRLGRNDRVLAHAPLWTEEALYAALLAFTTGAELAAPTETGDLGSLVERYHPTLVVTTPADVPYLLPRDDLRVLCVGSDPPKMGGSLTFLHATPLASAITSWTRDAEGRWLGRALTGGQISVLDRFGQPVEVGLPGQLHVSGKQLAAGFFARPDLTAQALTPDPLGGAGRRWHPTGALVRYRDNGDLEWLGPVWPRPDKPDERAPYLAARGPVEQVIAAIWADLLDAELVGIYEDFFELGGHSTLAMQVVTRLQAVFQQEIPVQALFEQPTVAGLATAITTNTSPPGQAEQIARIWLRISAAPTADAPEPAASLRQ